jgi:hypothetical protein
MRRTVLCATVMAAAASICGSASAALWQINNAAANGAPVPPNPFYVNNVGSFALNDGTSNINLSGQAANAVTQNLALESVLLGLGSGVMQASSGQVLVSFFGLHNTNDNLNYFGFVIDNQSGSNVTFNLSSSFFYTGSNGAISSNTNSMTAFGTPFSGHSVNSTSFAMGTGQADYFLFAGLDPGDMVGMGGAITPIGQITTVQWLDANYAVAYTDTTTGPGGQNVELGLATNVIPVPAPVLLAGAGLLGAAGLRRRLVKKAAA